MFLSYVLLVRDIAVEPLFPYTTLFRSGPDEDRLDLVRAEVGLALEQKRGGPRDDGSSHRRSAEAHIRGSVPRRHDAVGEEHVERASRHADRNDAPPRCDEIGLGVRVGGAPGGEPGERVVTSADGSLIVRRADGDGVRIDTRRYDRVAPRCAVPRTGNDDQTKAPRDLNGRRHRVRAVGNDRWRAKGKADDADVVGGAVGDDPLDPPDHRRDPTAPGAAEHPDVDDVGLRCDADELARGAAAVPRDDPRNMRPVPARVA